MPENKKSRSQNPGKSKNAGRTRVAGQTKDSAWIRDSGRTRVAGQTKDSAWTRDSGRTRVAGRAKDSAWTRDSGRTRVAGRAKDSAWTRDSGRTRVAGRTKVADQSSEIRLNKYIANAGICSRRQADQYILAGLVSINGKIIDKLGTKVFPGDKVSFNKKIIRDEKKVYILMNKPKDCVTTVDDPAAKFTVMDILGRKFAERVYPVGRLDRNTTGVLLLTNDGELTQKLTHPSYNKKKVYHVFLDKNFTHEALVKLTKGLVLDDGYIRPDQVNYADNADKSQVGIELHSGKNRIVRRIFEALGYKILKLDRVYFAGLTKKGLNRGQWRFLTEKEINMLNMNAYE